MARLARLEVLHRLRLRWCLSFQGPCGGVFCRVMMRSPERTTTIASSGLTTSLFISRDTSGSTCCVPYGLRPCGHSSKWQCASAIRRSPQPSTLQLTRDSGSGAGTQGRFSIITWTVPASTTPRQAPSSGLRPPSPQISGEKGRRNGITKSERSRCDSAEPERTARQQAISGCMKTAGHPADGWSRSSDHLTVRFTGEQAGRRTTKGHRGPVDERPPF